MSEANRRLVYFAQCTAREARTNFSATSFCATDLLTAPHAPSNATTVSVTLVVTAASSSPNDRNAGAAQALTFDQPRIVIGRGAHADVRVPSRAVSDTHAIVRFEGGDISIVDEASTNGTTVNGQPVVKGRKKALRSGDRIGIPGFEISVETSIAKADPPGHTMTVARRLLANALASSGGEAAPPELVLTTGRRAGRHWTLATIGQRMVAGRGDNVEIILDDADCSRAHGEFERDELGVIVRDLQSKNGVFVGGRAITQDRRLKHGDEVQMGRSVLAYSDPGEELLRAFEGGSDEPPSAPIPTPAAPSAHLGAVASQPESLPSLTPPERSAPTIPPPPGSSVSDSATSHASVPPAETPDVKAVARPSNAIQPRKKSGSAADWIVVALAVLILGVSAAALYVLLRGTPPPH